MWCAMASFTPAMADPTLDTAGLMPVVEGAVMSVAGGAVSVATRGVSTRTTVAAFSASLWEDTVCREDDPPLVDFPLQCTLSPTPAAGTDADGADPR